MRVAMYYNNSDIRIKEYTIPKIGKGEILIRVEASGICGSDLMEWYRLPKAPLVLGHEVTGEVVEVGEEVAKFKKGDRVIATHHVPCNNCYFCSTDRHTLCPSIKTTHFDPGGFAEFLRVPEINVDRGVFLLPDTVSYEEGSFVEPLGCVVRGQRVADFKVGTSVAIIGSGITGLLNLQYAIYQGAGFTCVFDVNDYKLKTALKFGADKAFDSREDAASRLRSNNDGRLADLVVVCTGVEAALKQALDLVEKGGIILFFAPSDPDFKLEIDFNDFWWSGVSIVTSYAASPKDLELALKLIEKKSVNVNDMITHRFPLSNIQEGFKIVEYSKENLKVIILPNS